MYKLFIVEDNPYTREDLQNVLDWEDLGIVVAGSFSNGSEALAKVEEIRPDIILTDIAMPIINGIELAKRLKEKHPSIKTVFMSAYIEFDFAKRAVDLGIYGYVLKPIVPDELKTAMEKLLKEYELESFHKAEQENMRHKMKEMLPFVQEQFFRELLFNEADEGRGGKRDREELDFLRLEIPDWTAHVMVLSVENEAANNADEVYGGHEKPQLDPSAAVYLLSYKIRNILNSAADESKRVFPVRISEYRFAVIVFTRPAITEANPSQKENPACPVQNEPVADAAADIHIALSRRLGLNALIGVSSPGKGLSDLLRLYRQARQAMDALFYNNSSPIVFYRDIEAAEESPLAHETHLEEVFKDVKELIALGDDEAIRAFADRYLGESLTAREPVRIKSLTFFIVNAAAIVLMESDHSFKDLFGDDVLIWRKLSRFETILDIRQWIINFFKTIKEYLNEKADSASGDRTARVVEDIKSVIKSRYAEQLTVKDIAAAVYLSPSYANSLFKKDTGMTIFDWFTRYRLEMAKKLLSDPESKVTVVAEEVGYISKAYFCLSFKKQVGMSPAEYRNRLLC